MKNLLIQIVKIIRQNENVDRDIAMGVIAPLKTEEQAIEMLDYLGTIDIKTTKTSPLIEKALEI